MKHNADGGLWKFLQALKLHFDMVDLHGYYRYKTNPNMFGTWIIAGNMRIVKELTYNEVVSKCAEYGLTPMPMEG